MSFGMKVCVIGEVASRATAYGGLNQHTSKTKIYEIQKSALLEPPHLHQLMST